MLQTMTGTLLKIAGYFFLFCYVMWALRVLWKLITRPDGNGRLPWL